MRDAFYIKDFALLDRLDWIKTLADRGRMAMVSLLAREPLTGSMVAERLGMPANLKAMGVTQAHADSLIEAVLADHCAATNPRKMTRTDVQSLFADALG